MKKRLAILLISLLIMSLGITSFGQKTRTSNSTISKNKITTEYDYTQAFTDTHGVFIKWQMKVETNNLGFNIYRLEGTQKIPVNPGIVGGAFFRNSDRNVFGESYSFFDATGSFGDTYVIESLDLSGDTVASEYIFPKFVADLTPIAGNSSEFMIEASGRKNNLVEKNDPVLPREVQTEIQQNLLPPDINKQRFIASQPGVKIGVKKEGIYRVSSTELTNAGFNVNSISANWQLYVNGVEQAMTVGAGGSSYIEFYGKGVDTNETDTQVYYLINGATRGKRIGSSIRRRIGGLVLTNSYETSTFKQDRDIYFSTIRNGELSNFFSNKVINSTGATVNFTLNDVDLSSAESSVKVTVQGLTFLPHSIEVKLNNVSLGNILGNNQNSMSREFIVPTSLLTEGQNTLFFKTPDGTSDISIFDSVLVKHKKLYKTRTNALSFYTHPYRASTVTGFTSANIRVFDLTYPDSPKIVNGLSIITNGGDFGVHLPANRSNSLFAVENSGILQAASVVQNTPSTLSTTNNNGEFIVISYKDWITEANTWANYRANEGFTAKVVDIADVFDEFNYGRVSANPIKAFLQYAKENWQTPPKYVLLLGDTSYDPRDYENRGSINYMPVKMVDTLYEETGSDEAMADFNEDGLADLAIGRVPAKNAATVALTFNKTVIFEQTVTTGLSRGVLFASDCPQGYDFTGLSQRLANELPSGTNYFMVNRCGTTDARTALLNELNNGRFMVNYSGHGATGLWATTNFYSLPDVANIANGDNLSIFTMLTCLNGYFLRTDASSLAEDLLHKQNGGAVIAWSSTGKTTPDVQEVMAKKFYQNISDPSILRLGDSINVAKQNVNGGRDVRLSWALLGDPMLKIK